MIIIVETQDTFLFLSILSVKSQLRKKIAFNSLLWLHLGVELSHIPEVKQVMALFSLSVKITGERNCCAIRILGIVKMADAGRTIFNS